MHNEKYVLKIYRSIYVIAALIIGIMTIVTRKMYGEGVGINLNVDTATLILLLAINVGMIYLVIPLFNLLKRITFVTNGSYGSHRLVCDQRKIHIFIFILFILQIVFTLHTGNGIVGNEHQASGTTLAYVFNILKLDAFMPIYYIAARDTKKKLYWINVMLWLIYDVICGWSSTILEIVFLEFFLRAKYRKASYNTSLLYRASALIATIATLVGGFLYKYMYALKNTIRYGINIQPLSYGEGLSRLISRFTSFPLSIVALQNNSTIVNLYRAQGVSCPDVRAILRPLVPGSLMNKNFRTLNNIIIQSMYVDVSNTTSSNYPLPLFWMNLINSSIFDFVIYIVVVIALLIVSKKIIYLFDDGSNDVDILYFFLLFNFLNGNSIENLFGYGYVGLIYFIPIMLLLGVIKIEKINFRILSDEELSI